MSSALRRFVQRYAPSPLLHQAALTLTDAQIKALPSSSYVVVPEPRNDCIIIPTRGLIATNFAAGAYVAAAGASVWLIINDGSSAVYSSAITPTQDILQSTTPALKDISCPFLSPGTGPFDGIVVPQWSAVESTGGRGRPLELTDSYIGVANYTGGHVNNRMHFVVEFRVLDALRHRFLTVTESGWSQSAGVFA